MSSLSKASRKSSGRSVKFSSPQKSPLPNPLHASSRAATAAPAESVPSVRHVFDTEEDASYSHTSGTAALDIRQRQVSGGSSSSKKLEDRVSDGDDGPMVRAPFIINIELQPPDDDDARSPAYGGFEMPEMTEMAANSITKPVVEVTPATPFCYPAQRRDTKSGDDFNHLGGAPPSLGMLGARVSFSDELSINSAQLGNSASQEPEQNVIAPPSTDAATYRIHVDDLLVASQPPTSKPVSPDLPAPERAPEPGIDTRNGDEIVLNSRMTQFLQRLCVKQKQDNDDEEEEDNVGKSRLNSSGSGGMIEVHRLKRVTHAAKLTNIQRSKIIPVHAQKKKLVPADICAKNFARHVAKSISDAETIMLALESLSDAVINSQESVLAMIEDRLARIVSDNRAKFADNTFRKIWDTLHLLSIITFYVISLQQNIIMWQTDVDSNNRWILILFVLFTVFWAFDVFISTQVFAIDKDGRLVKDRMAIIGQRRNQLIVDAFGLVPIDFILEGVGAPFIAFLVFRVIKFVKVVRVSYLYELVNRDVITPAIVVFHFQVKKILIGVSWLVLFILTCGTVHNLIDIYIIEPQYEQRMFPTLADSVVAVCIVLAGSNASFNVWVEADKIMYIFLAVLSMIGIGLVVGQLTSLVFTNSVSAENYQLMRDTLGIIEHYNVPRAIQREVLSFQMHALNDDVVRHMTNLAQLPLQMQQEIMMYIKIDAIAKVKLFSGASAECKTVLASSLARCIVEPEVEIIRFGEVGTEMYMMAHGYADVILGNGKVVTTFTRGDCFGEMALVQKDAKRTATVRALTYCDLWTLEKEIFLEALAVYPDFLKVIEAELVNRKGNVQELRESVDAVHQELIKMENEKETGVEDTAEVPPLRKAPSANILAGHLSSDEGDLNKQDVHVDHGISSHWNSQRMNTFRRMSLDPANVAANHRMSFTRRESLARFPTKKYEHGAVSSIVGSPGTNLQSEVANAKKAIDAAKQRLKERTQNNIKRGSLSDKS